MVSRPAPRSSVADVETERPQLGRLSGIVAVCFGAGVLWPLFAGLELAPRPPGSEARSLAEAAAASIADPSTPAGAIADSDAESDEVEEVPVTITDRQLARTLRTEVASCKDARGKAVEHCDRPPLRDAIEEPLSRLSQCGAAQGLAGTLSLGMQLDFKRRRLTGLKPGKATTLARDKVSALLSCARTELSGVSLKDIAHEQSEYWMYFAVEFIPPGSRIEPDVAERRIEAEIVEASGYATVGWNTAVVREAPAADGAIAARLLFGTRIRVTGRLGDWYRVAYDAKGRIGWVHRNEVGM
jgi:SH3 domain-containing protein